MGSATGVDCLDLSMTFEMRNGKLSMCKFIFLTGRPSTLSRGRSTSPEDKCITPAIYISLLGSQFLE